MTADLTHLDNEEVHKELVRHLGAETEALRAENDGLRDEIMRLRMHLGHIREVWAGADGGELCSAQEAYAIRLCKEMYAEACQALAHQATAGANRSASESTL